MCRAAAMRARQLCGLLLFLSLPLCFAQGKYDPCDVQGQYTSLGKVRVPTTAPTV